MKNYLLNSATFILFCFIISQNVMGQKALTTDIFTDPQSWPQGISSLGIQLQSERHAPFLGLCSSVTYQAQQRQVGDYNNQFSEFSWGAEVRIYPFNVQSLFRKKPRAYPEMCNGRFGCLRGKKKTASHLLSGLYVATGYQYKKVETEYFPSPDLESPITSFPFTIKNNGLTFNVGYQIRISHITLGASYGFTAAKPRWSGPVDVFGTSLMTTTYPVEARIDKNLRLEVGFNF
jgi:hypothetical protein